MKAEQTKSTDREPFVSGDPILRLLKNRWRVNSWLDMRVIVLALNIPIAVLAVANQALLDQPGRTGLLHDYAWWIYQFSSVPATILFFLWMPEGIQSVLKGLRRNRTILEPEGQEAIDAFQVFIARFDRNYSHWRWLTICLIVVTAFMFAAVVPEHRVFKGWQTSGAVLFWYHEAYWYLIFLLGTLIIVRVMISIYWFNRLFREFRVDIKVLHPDGAGGLSPLGSFSVKVGYLIGILGVAAVAAVWSHTAYLLKGESLGPRIEPAIMSMIVVYLIVGPIVFFAPIGTAHSAMRTAKDEFLLRIANQFEMDFAKIQTDLGKDSGELNARLDKIEQLEKIHKLARSFPVWPFNTASLVRFFSSTLSPLLLALIPSIIALMAR